MTIPYVPNGVPAPQGTFPMPPGQATFNAPVPQQPVQVVPQETWRGYPASQLPAMPQPAQAPQPQAPSPQQQFGLPQQPQVAGYPTQYAQPQAPAQPQYQVGMPVHTQHAQPSTQPGQQFQPQAQPQTPAGIDPNTILQGPAFPPELQGVSLGQAIQMYGGMRNLVMSVQQRQIQSAAAPQAQPQTQTSAPAPQQPQGQPAFDWRNPGQSLAAVIGPMLNEALDKRLAPITEQNAMQQANVVRNSIAQEVGPQRFAQIESAVMGYLNGATAQDLANPELWRVAVRTALGDQVLRGQAPQGRPAQIPGSQPFVPGTPNPAPPLASFFTESPQAGGQPVQGVTLTPAQMWYADQMGVPYATYAAYAQGVPPVLPANGGRI